MEENLRGDLVVFALPEKRRGRLRTTKPQVSINMLEVVNGEIKRRASGKMFSSDGLLIRLVSAILMEISEEWETGCVYLDMISENESSNTDSSQIYRKNVEYSSFFVKKVEMCMNMLIMLLSGIY